MSVAEQEAAYADAIRDYETGASSDSALRLAIVTIASAQSVDELLDALALVETAAGMQDASADPSFFALLGSLAEHLAEREGALQQERRDKLALRDQLDALRRLEQELATQ